MASKEPPTLSPPALRAKPSADRGDVGSSGLVRNGDWVGDEWHRMLAFPRALRVYREISDNDSTVGASFNAIDSMVRMVKWYPKVADHRLGQEAADFQASCVGDMEHSWADFLGELVVGMLTFGFGWFQKVWKYRQGPFGATRSMYADGRLGLRKMSVRAQETLDGWAFEEDGTVSGMYQRASPDYNRVLVPRSISAHFRPRSMKNNPEGRSALRNAFRAWWFLKRLEELEAIIIERSGVGLLKVELPHQYFAKDASPEKKQAVLDWALQAAQVRRNEHDGLVVPSELEAGKVGDVPTGFRTSFMSLQGTGSIDTDKPITRHRTSIGQTMLTQFIFFGTDKVGTQALSTDITQLFALALSAILDVIEDTWHRDVTVDMMELNGYPVEAWPRWCHGDVEKKDVRPLAESLLKLVDAGMITPDDTLETYIRNEMRLPDKEEPVDGEDDDIDPSTAAAQQTDTATMIDRVSSAIQRLVQIGDYDLANALRDALAGMMGLDTPPPLKPGPAPATGGGTDPNADPNAGDANLPAGG